MSRRTWGISVAVLILSAGLYFALSAPAGPRSLREFDSDRTASLELSLWQAYYAKEKVRLFGLLVVTLREEYHYSWLMAARGAFYLGRAAAGFDDVTSGYDRVLPDLEKAYGIAAAWLHAGFDPRKVARAELAWWVARRTPGHDSPEEVGRLIAEEYALLYEAPAAGMMIAGQLRAEAAALRDSQASAPDWPEIARLLVASYRELRGALTSAAAD